MILPFVLMFKEQIKRSNLDAKRDSNPFISFSIAEIRVLNAASEVLVVADRVEVEDVELPSSDVRAFFVWLVAISEGGARFDWKVDTESSSSLSFSKTCRSPRLLWMCF